MNKHKFVVIYLTAILLIALVGQVYALGIAPDLGTAITFAVLGHSTVTNTGNSVISGNVGLSPGTSVTGFPPGIVVPPSTIYIAEATAAGAQADATAAFIDLGNQACDFEYDVPTDLAGMTLDPGVYCFESSVENTGLLTLNGGSNDVWIFKSGSTFTAGPGSSVVGGGDGCNIFWYVGSSGTMDTTSASKGTFIANQSISMNNGASLDGRVIALNGAVTLINNVIDVTICSGLTPGGVGVTKLFGPSRIRVGNESTLTITFTNAEQGIATLSNDFTDTFPDGVFVADVPNLFTDCGGTASIGVDGDTVTLEAGSTIPAADGGIPGYCTLTVDVTSSTVGTYTNGIPADALNTTLGSNAAPASAVLVVRPAPTGDDDDEGEDEGEGEGLPAFPGTGSGALILNEILPLSWLIFGGLSTAGFAIGYSRIRKSKRKK